MHLVLAAPSELTKVLDVPANRNYEPQRVLDLLDALAAHGVGWDSLDLSAVGGERLGALYWEATTVALRLHIQVSRVFGSRRTSGLSGFGIQVPALLTYDLKGAPLTGVFPHTRKHGPLVTITSFLTAELARHTNETSGETSRASATPRSVRSVERTR
jgi:hypothetical protein